MRRITMWITATVTAVALMLAYQANVSGATGKQEPTNSGAAATAEKS